MENYNEDQFGKFQDRYQQYGETSYEQEAFGYGNTFEAGSPVYTKAGLKETLQQEVVSKSFLFMFAALLISAIAAVTTPAMVAARMITGTNYLLLFFGELAIVFAANLAISKNKAVVAGCLYAVYAYMTGMLLSVIFLIYSLGSVVTVFLGTSALFLVMAVVGIVTKKDLTGIGGICFMALLGVIIMGALNVFFLRSPGFDLGIDILCVLIFVGLTAYDTQKIKNMVAYSNEQNVLSLSLLGGFSIYLDFINLFLRLLRLFGKRK